MGFLNRLLKKEASKILSGVVDQVVDSAKEALNQAGFPAGESVSRATDAPVGSGQEVYTGGGAGSSFEISADEESCYGEADVVETRIRNALAENFADCELVRNVSAGSIGLYGIEWDFTYAIYKNGAPVAVINLLYNQNDYRRKVVLQSKEACAGKGIGYTHFLMHLPNRYSYVEAQVKKILA